MSRLLHALGAVLAKTSGMTETQARGTLRLLLRDHGVDPSIARKDDLRALLGPPLEEALAKRHLSVGAGGMAAVRRALDTAPELDDAYDLFTDMD